MMDGWMDVWMMDGWMMDGWTGDLFRCSSAFNLKRAGWTLADTWTLNRTERVWMMDGWMMDGWIRDDGWMDGWKMDGWTDG